MAAATTKIRYVATRPLTVEYDGERSVLKPGDPIRDPEAWGRTLTALVEQNRVVEVPVPTAETLALVDDDLLVAEMERRGYRVTRARKQTGA